MLKVIETANGRCKICPRCGREIPTNEYGFIYCGGGAAYECDCGQWYTPSGEDLKPPEDWEEDY